MSQSHGRVAFTLVELLVVIAVVAILASLLLPSLARAKDKARTTQCVSNLRQWNLTLSLYLEENDECIPRRGQGVQPLFIIDRPDDWFNALPPLLSLPSYQELVMKNRIPAASENTIFACPAAKRTAHTNFLSYAMNIYLSPWIRPNPHRLSEIPRPDSLVFLADGPCAYSSTAPSVNAYSVQARHVGRATVAFLDGHVERFSGDYLGCGKGEPDPPRCDVHWQTETSGPNQAPLP
jgi:prepilin-type processing-associated H-X9-DG protein/prepilin-type N-terminal cleavage/methylation domain-containing protein